MLRDRFDHGLPPETWRAAKNEAREIMVARARQRRTIAYSDLVAAVRSLSLQPRDPRLFHLLGEISSEEDAAGRGMLTVVVVHKSGDMAPGPGFYELAQSLGRQVGDKNVFWIQELNRVFEYWTKSGGRG
jgi:hypothetical protein